MFERLVLAGIMRENHINHASTGTETFVNSPTESERKSARARDSRNIAAASCIACSFHYIADQ